MVLEALGSKLESLTENAAVAMGLKKPRMSKTDKIISGVAFAVFTALSIALLAAGVATATTGLGLAVTLPLVIASQACMLVAIGVGIRASYKLYKPEVNSEWLAVKDYFANRAASMKQRRADEQKMNEEVRAAASVAATERRERYASKHNAIADKYGFSKKRL